MRDFLTASQRAAIDQVASFAKARSLKAREAIENVRKMCNVSSPALESAVEAMKTHARVALHFHPDRPDRQRRSVAEALLESGRYKSQFETSLSNGSVSAHPGGERDRWEESLFGGAYQRAGTGVAERPKYGALDLMLHADGPAPRFGSCYFLLKPEVGRRCTFTYLDSHQDPRQRGTLEELDDVLAALLEEIFYYDFALGETGLTVPRLLDHLTTRLASGKRAKVARNLNHYIEAQVHGEVRLDRDIESLVADPSFHGTPVGATLEKLCTANGIALAWHPGFALLVDKVPPDFRGPTMPALARRITTRDYFTTSDLGAATAEELQEIKLLWHVLVRFGDPLAGFASSLRSSQ